MYSRFQNSFQFIKGKRDLNEIDNNAVQINPDNRRIINSKINVIDGGAAAGAGEAAERYQTENIVIYIYSHGRVENFTERINTDVPVLSLIPTGNTIHVDYVYNLINNENFKELLRHVPTRLNENERIKDIENHIQSAIETEPDFDVYFDPRLYYFPTNLSTLVHRRTAPDINYSFNNNPNQNLPLGVYLEEHINGAINMGNSERRAATDYIKQHSLINPNKLRNMVSGDKLRKLIIKKLEEIEGFNKRNLIFVELNCSGTSDEDKRRAQILSDEDKHSKEMKEYNKTYDYKFNNDNLKSIILEYMADYPDFYYNELISNKLQGSLEDELNKYITEKLTERQKDDLELILETYIHANIFYELVNKFNIQNAPTKKEYGEMLSALRTARSIYGVAMVHVDPRVRAEFVRRYNYINEEIIGFQRDILTNKDIIENIHMNKLIIIRNFIENGFKKLEIITYNYHQYQKIKYALSRINYGVERFNQLFEIFNANMIVDENERNYEQLSRILNNMILVVSNIKNIIETAEETKFYRENIDEQKRYYSEIYAKLLEIKINHLNLYNISLTVGYTMDDPLDEEMNYGKNRRNMRRLRRMRRRNITRRIKKKSGRGYNKKSKKRKSTKKSTKKYTKKRK
jgi:hypothetical protein